MTEANTRKRGRPRSGYVITELAELPKDTLLDETALARVLRINKRTVRRMVSRFELPPPVRFGGRSTWQAGRILAHFSKAAERAEKRARKIFAQIDKIA